MDGKSLRTNILNVYIGNSTVTPSRRALIPQQQSVFVEYASCGGALLLSAEWNASLDIERGMFSNTTAFEFEDCSCLIELTWIAHRTMHNISALRIAADRADANCLFMLSSCNGNKSTDVTELMRVESESNASSSVYGIVYETLLPEKPEGGPLTNVTIVFNEIPGIISGEQTFTSLLQVFSSAWVSVGVSYSMESQFLTFSTLYNSYSWDDLINEHVAGWADLWQSGVELTGNETIAAAVNASLYYILSSVSQFSPWSISPGGLPKNSYNGHVFWDCETWMLPAVVPFFPEIAESFVQYRTQRLAEAIDRALTRGYEGAMFPWESASTGIDVTPIPNIEGDYEIHVTADIALAARLVWYWTGDDEWMFGDVWDMVIACANYFVSRVDCLISAKYECLYTIYDVMPPDELAGVVNHSVYTNAAAAVLLDWVADELYDIGDSEDAALYGNIAGKMYIPESDQLWTRVVHPEYDGYSGEPINQADAVLLQFPLLFEMSDDIAYNDLRYYENLTSIPGVTKGYYTGDSSYSIAYLSLHRKNDFNPPDGVDLKALADHQFEQAFEHIDSDYYYIWHETVSGGHVNFVTGAGGFLQNILYGYGGILANSDGMIVNNPVLPHLGITELKFRHLKYRGSTFSLSYGSSKMNITVHKGSLYIYVENGGNQDKQWDLVTTLSVSGDSVSMSLQKVLLTSQKIYSKKRKKDDDIEKFFTEYYPYIILGGLFLLNGCAYLLYKCIFKFPVDEGTISLFAGGCDSTVADSKL